LASPNTLGHSPKARLVVTMIEVRSWPRPAAEVLDDPLPGAAALAHALDQVEVAVGADLFLTDVHAAKQHAKSFNHKSLPNAII
jgi:hypothetical protein